MCIKGEERPRVRGRVYSILTEHRQLHKGLCHHKQGRDSTSSYLAYASLDHYIIHTRPQD